MSDYTKYTLVASSSQAAKAAEILSDELKKRHCTESADFTKTITLVTDDSIENKDSYRIEVTENGLVMTAKGIRGLVYAVGRFLRKTEYNNGRITLVEDISGEYSPYMKIRGHQLGYRVTANTYEAWTPDEYYTYIKELMYVGCNTFEHTIFNESDKTNRLMKYSQPDMVHMVNEKAKELDMDISYWCPNDDKPAEESAEVRADFFRNQPYGDIYFPPGSDPGDFDADVLVDRVQLIAREIRKHHPDMQLWPSAQSPDGFGKWGDDFICKMNEMPSEIDGVITGPNCAMPLHELRKRLPLRYPIRLYPDITHNVRCEYPVHFDRDDWHYALASTLSRETINPRPSEYRAIHRLTRQYIVGSVSYSEGIHDDVNKFIWSDMDFDPDVTLNDSLSDYARLFFPGADTKKIVSGILGLEKNWEGDPWENPHIEFTHKLFSDVIKENPELWNNVRFLMCLFRAKCDLLVKMRREKENELVKKAGYYLARFDIPVAERVLNTPLGQEYDLLHDEIFRIGNMLFEMAGMQLDVEHYCALGWERGATLDTIDNPVSDRLWLLDRINYCLSLDESERNAYITALLGRNSTKKGEVYFSFAEHGFTQLGIPQEPYFYMDYQGDRPNVNNGTIPMSMLKVFDHYSFRMKAGGLENDREYELWLNIKPRYRDEVDEFTIKINSHVLYKGKQYGGERDGKWDKAFSAPGFEIHRYKIPRELIENGCVDIEITEPKIGIMLCEVFIR